jgi:hypothetical protein
MHLAHGDALKDFLITRLYEGPEDEDHGHHVLVLFVRKTESNFSVGAVVQSKGLRGLVWTHTANGHTKGRVRWTTVAKGRPNDGSGVVAPWNNEQTYETLDTVAEKISTKFIRILVMRDEVLGRFAV